MTSRPTLFGQFGDEKVTEVARDLDNPRQPQGGRRRVRHGRTPQAVQFRPVGDLAIVAAARRGARTSRSSSSRRGRSTTIRRRGARLGRSVTSFNEQREEFAGQLVRPDGTFIDYVAMPLPDGATLMTFADVTDSKKYERALEERNQALVAADRMKNAFISHVSYELRTPLTNIIGFSDLLGSPHIGVLNQKQEEYLGDISASSKTLLAIIDDILTLATMDAGTMELKQSRVDVPAVIDTAILGVREAAQRARLSLHIAVADDATRFVADEARLRQILFNLLSNAVGFSKPGDTIGITARREDGMMVFVIEDNGVGIPKDEQSKVFDRFESRSLGSGHRGAGLGLSIVKSLVEMHGGTVSLESEPGLGTRVTVRLPAQGRPAKAGLPQLPQEGPEGPLSAGGSRA
ncbi:MAG: ATP-binding protein [Hyphomicrobium sp.]